MARPFDQFGPVVAADAGSKEKAQVLAWQAKKAFEELINAFVRADIAEEKINEVAVVETEAGARFRRTDDVWVGVAKVPVRREKYPVRAMEGSREQPAGMFAMDNHGARARGDAQACEVVELVGRAVVGVEVVHGPHDLVPEVPREKEGIDHRGAALGSLLGRGAMIESRRPVQVEDVEFVPIGAQPFGGEVFPEAGNGANAMGLHRSGEQCGIGVVTIKRDSVWLPKYQGLHQGWGVSARASAAARPRERALSESNDGVIDNAAKD